jgi:hypothetical protein
VPESPEANNQAESQEASTGGNALKAVIISIAAWLVPGLGHLLLRKWGRAAIFFVGVAALALAGLLLRGNVFAPWGDDPFGTLGFLADVGSGVFYFISKSIESAGPDVSRAAGDYGTRFFATAGVLNFLCALDAHEIARGRKA